jgi:hypothetical protein
VFVLDLAHDLLEDVLDGDDAHRAAVLVHHHRELDAALLHLAKEGVDALGLRGIGGGPHDGAEVGRLGSSPEKIHGGDEPDQIEHPVGEQREAREAALGDEAYRVVGMGGRGQGDHVHQGHHDLAHRLLAEVEDLVDHLRLGHRHVSFLGFHLKKQLELLARDELPRARGRAPEQAQRLPTTALAPQVKGVSTRLRNSMTRKRDRMSAVAHSRATALGITSPRTSMTGVSAAVTRKPPTRPITGMRAQVATEDAVMWAMVTPIMRWRAAAPGSGTPPGSGWRSGARLRHVAESEAVGAMNDISAPRRGPSPAGPSR